MLTAPDTFRRWRILAAAALFVLLAGPVHAKLEHQFSSGAWAGAVYSDDTTGKFSHCLGSGDYKSGITMYVSVNRSYGWLLGFSSPSWNLQIGSKIALRYRIDKTPWLEAAATAITPQGVTVPMANEETLIRLFRLGRLLHFNDYRTDYYFDLTGTNRLIQDLASCVQAQLSFEDVMASLAPAPTNTSQEDARTEEKLSSGSGIIISALGNIITNNHVVDGCEKLIVQRSGEMPVTAQVIAQDSTNDLALLQSNLRTSDSDVAIINVARPIRAGEYVAVYGFPLVGTLSTTGNIVAGNITSLAGIGDDVRFFQISAPVQPGNSGGPLLDEYGNVVGVVNAKLNEIAWAKETGDLPQNVNFAIKASVLSSFLDAHSSNYHSTILTYKYDLPVIAQRAQKFTALIMCVK